MRVQTKAGEGAPRHDGSHRSRRFQAKAGARPGVAGPSLLLWSAGRKLNVKIAFMNINPRRAEVAPFIIRHAASRILLFT